MATLPAATVASSRSDRAPTQEATKTTLPKRLARIVGVLYLLVSGVRTVKPVKQDERIPAAA